jgi:hypothetical protein
MKTLTIALVISSWMMGQAPVPEPSKQGPFRPHLADYDSELRQAGGRVDIDAMVARLQDLGVTTYYWLIWHAPTDWDDLKLFLPRAAQAGIDVWVYLVPPSESPPRYGNRYSEPFRLDYARWGEEIAKLSREHANLTAWVIDDFYANRAFYTPAYLREMQARAKRINPRLAFLPLMYFREIGTRFVEDYRQVIDGVVVAYLQDRDEIERTWAVLNDADVAAPSELGYPGNTPSQAGDFILAGQSAQVRAADRYTLSFRERDDFTGPTAGYHFKQLLVDETVVWEEDVAGGTPVWRKVVVDVTEQVRGKTNITVAFRLFDKKGVSNFGVRWRLSDLSSEGLQFAADLTEPGKWKTDRRGAFEAGFGGPAKKGERRFHIPFISMTAGDIKEFGERHGDPATPERVAAQLRWSLQAWREGKCDGVVTYCLDKRPQSRIFPLAQKLFHEFRSSPPKPGAAQAFEVSDRRVRIAAGILERVIDLANGNLSTTRLRADGHELLVEPAFELSFTVTRAEPNARPRGLKPGEGGSIDSVQTFRPGHHVDPGTFDDAPLGQTTRWVEPVRIRAGQWSDHFTLDMPEVSTPSPDVSRLAIRAHATGGQARPGPGERDARATGLAPKDSASAENVSRASRPRTAGGTPATQALDGLALTLVYEVYRGAPVVRKWVEIENRSNVWRKIEQLTIDDIAFAPSISERAPLTPAGYGVGTSMIGFASSDGTFGVIAANEIPSGLRTIADHGALGYDLSRFEWVLGPGEKFVSEPVFLYAFSGAVEPTISARSTPLDRAVEGPFQHFLSRHIGIVGEKLPCDAPQWLTWANFGPNLDDALIRQQADRAARAGFVQFLIDDGWQRDRLGTEPDTAKFPDFAATADYIRSRGLKLGLWLSCFRDANSPDRQALPDARSLPVVTRLGGIAMSFTTPWREFYAQDLARLHERYGAVYFKQDFSNLLYGDLAEGHPSRTRKESLLRGLRGLLEVQDRLRALAPDVMNELTHEIVWDTPGAPCDLAALKHAARYHVSPNACRGIVPRPKPGQKPPVVDPQKLRAELLAACYQARQIFYAHRGLPLYCLEFYGAATEDHGGSMTPEVQDRQVVSWLMGAPLVFSGDLSTLSDQHLAHYQKRFALVNRLHKSWDIYRHFQFSGVPAPNDDDWHWWGKLNDAGYGAVVVVRGRGTEEQGQDALATNEQGRDALATSGDPERRAINIPWVLPERRYTVTGLFHAQRLGTFTGRQLQTAGVEVALPVYGQEILELTPAQ